VVLFKFAEDDKVMLDAQYKVTSGQADVLVRDESILKKLPALYRPQEARPSPLKMMADQVRNLQGALDQLEAKGEGDTQQAQAIRGQIQALQKRIDEIAAEKADETDDKQDADQKPDVIKGAPKIKAAPQPKKPGGGN
jgi:TolA-binding protein